MIISSGNPSTDLYVKNLFCELFPEVFFSESENIFVESSVEYNESSVRASTIINGNTFRAEELLINHQNVNLATTCALGKAIIAYAQKLGRDVPPYGVLIGVRPFKIASAMLEKFTEDETLERLKSVYLIHNDKASLLVSTAHYDTEMKRRHKANDCSVYISIPFCPSRCNYCSFVSSAIPTKLDMLDLYLDKLIEEIKALSVFLNKNHYNVNSIYIGGGTPTVLSSMQIGKLTDAVSCFFDIASLKEFTVEGGRPETITEDKVEILKKCGVDRICVNCQTTNDDVLRAIGRRHTKEDFLLAFETVKKYGFKTINTDIIAGLEAESFDSFKNTVNDVISLCPENVTVHTLCLKKSSDMRFSGHTNFLSDNISKFIEYSRNKCITSGYEPYYLYKQKYSVSNHENVGYCKKGHESHYNIAMMNEIETVFGVGAGATTKITDINKNGKIEHFENYKYPTEYVRDQNKQINNYVRMQELINSAK